MVCDGDGDVFVYVLACYGECHLSLIAIAVAARATTAVFSFYCQQ